jgi:hypothetical protein
MRLGRTGVKLADWSEKHFAVLGDTSEIKTLYPAFQPSFRAEFDRVSGAEGLADTAIDANPGSMTSMVSPSRKQSAGHSATQSMYLQRMQFSVTT